ncbi:ABC transporter substrate-binding protein [Spirillospora sp. CA-255316]
MELSRRELMRTSAFATAAAMAAPVLGACGSASNQVSGPDRANEADLQDYHERAKKEGKLTLWAANLDTTQGALLVGAFKKKYPGIEVEALFPTASVAFQRAATDFDSRRYKLDVFGTSDETQCQILKSKKALAEFLPPIPSVVPEQYRSIDGDNTYQASALGLIVIAVNSGAVQNPPGSWTDLRSGTWAGKISLGHPAYSGAMLQAVLGVVQLHGWDYWKEIGKLKPKVNQSILDVNRDLLSGERSVATANDSSSFESKSKGRPIGVVVPSDGAVLQINSQAVMRNAPHPYAARLFQSFLFSTEAAQIMRDVWRVPLRSDVEAKSKIDLAKIKTVRNSAKTIADSRDEVSRRWREYMGV